MRAAIITGARSVEHVEFKEPRPATNGVVVDVRYCGICGTDVHAFARGAPYPATLCGHEWTGTVSAVGREVDTIQEGDRVVVSILPPCGRCAACAAGHGDWCPSSLGSLSHDPAGSPHGAYAPRIAASAARVVRVHHALTDEEAALVEPATVAFHGVRRAGIELGDTVVVQGCGPIGALALQWARVCGAGRVVMIEPNVTRAALAATLGADLVLDPEEADATVPEITNGLGADVVIECAGIPATIQSAVDQVRRGGSVMLIGLSDLPASIVPTSWLMKEVTVRGSMAYLHTEFEACMDMIAGGRVDVRPLHTSTVPLASLGDALHRLADGARDAKVLVDPRG